MNRVPGEAQFQTQVATIQEANHFDVATDTLKAHFPELDESLLHRLTQDIRVRAALIAAFVYRDEGSHGSFDTIKNVLEQTRFSPLISEAARKLNDSLFGVRGDTQLSVVRGRYPSEANKQPVESNPGALPVKMNLSADLGMFAAMSFFSFGVATPVALVMASKRMLRMAGQDKLKHFFLKRVTKLEKLIAKSHSLDGRQLGSFLEEEIVPVLEEAISYYHTLHTEEIWCTSKDTLRSIATVMQRDSVAVEQLRQFERVITQLIKKLGDIYRCVDEVRTQIAKIKEGLVVNKETAAISISAQTAFSSDPGEELNTDLDVDSEVLISAETIRCKVEELISQLRQLT